MRQGQQQNRRGRGRSNNNNNNQNRGGKNQNPLSRSFESNGPEVKIRGTPAHIAEKYIALARDALSSGDTVMAENHLQHAEHYNRIIMAYREQMQTDQQNNNRNNHQNGGGRHQSQNSDNSQDAAASRSASSNKDQSIDQGGAPQPVLEGAPQPSADRPREARAPRRQSSERSGGRPPRQPRSRNGNGRPSASAANEAQPVASDTIGDVGFLKSDAKPSRAKKVETPASDD